MTIELTRRDEFAIVTIRRPEVLNALNYATLHKLDDLLGEVEKSDARVLFFTGEGNKAFCAGADIGELMNRTVAENYEGTWLGQRVFSKIEKLKQPSIALVNGYAVGGGCELSLACTFRFASVNARFGLPEVKLGLVPGYGGTQRLPRLIGLPKALDVMMTGRMVGAEEAQQIGLANQVVSGDLLEAGIAFARTFSQHSLLAMKLIRDSAQRGLDASLQDGLRLEADLSTVSMLSNDGKEGAAAFLAKRPANFQDC
jgi:enoyl-CoA hydratase